MFVIGAIERRVAAEQDKEDHANRPQIALLVVVLLKDFWGDVVGRAKLLRHLLRWVDHSRSSEVDDGHLGVVGVLVEQQVFWLHVAVHDVALVAVGERREHLLDDAGGVALAERVLLRNAFKQLAAIA